MSRKFISTEDAVFVIVVVLALFTLCFSCYKLGTTEPLDTEKFFIEQCLYRTPPATSYAVRAEECATAYRIYTGE